MLAAMGALTHGNVRVSLTRDATEADVDGFLAVLPGVVAELRARTLALVSWTPTLELDCRGAGLPAAGHRAGAHGSSEVAVGQTVVAVASDDAAARYDIPAWCRMRGQEYVGEEPPPDGTVAAATRRCRPAQPGRGAGAGRSRPVGRRVRRRTAPPRRSRSSEVLAR